MKKLFTVLVAVSMILPATKTFAQYYMGQVNISLGYGYPNLIGSVFEFYETNDGYNATSLGPMYLKGEYGITDRIGLGLSIAYAANKVTYTSTYTDYDSLGNPIEEDYEYEIKRTTLSVLGRVNFHFGDFEKFDPYFGVGMGYRNANWTFTSTQPGYENSTELASFLPFGFDFTVGARYYFNDFIGVYAELGIAKSPVQAGVCCRFGG